MSYKDKTWCSQHTCMNTLCKRRLSDADVNYINQYKCEVSFSDFKDTEECPGFLSKPEPTHATTMR